MPNNHQEDPLYLSYLRVCQQLRLALTHYDQLIKDAPEALKHTPWYIVLGTPHSGKTQMLTSSQLHWLNEPHLHHIPHHENSPDPYHGSYFSKEAIYIEITCEPATLRRQDEKEPEQSYQALTRREKSRLRKYCQGILLCIDSIHLIHHHNQNYLLQCLRTGLANVQAITKKHIPIQIIFSKADQIRGFSEFFSMLSDQDPALSIPLHFSQFQDKVLFQKQFDIHFQKMLDRLNRQILDKLQSEPILLNRVLINEFPLQIETYKQAIMHLIDDVISLCGQNLKNAIFCSAQHVASAHDKLNQPLTQVFDVDTLPIVHQTTKSMPLTKAIATQYALQALKKPDAMNKPSSRKDTAKKTPWLRISLRSITISAVSFLLVASGIFWLHNIRQNIQTLTHAEKNLIEFNDQLNQLATRHFRVNDLLAMLSKLRHSMQATQNNPHAKPKFDILAIEKSGGLQRFAAHVYQQALLKTLGMLIQHSLAFRLKQSLKDNPNALYESLKLYLMLSGKTYMQHTFFMSWLKDYLHRIVNLNEVQKKQIYTDLQYLTTHYPKEGLALNTFLINKARQKLLSLPKSMRAFLILKDYLPGYVYDPLNLKTEQPQLLVYGAHEPALPGIYAADNFQNVFVQLIPRACKEATLGNWVLGDLKTTRQITTLQKPMLTNLNRQVQQLYLTYYRAWWSNIIRHLRLVPIHQLTQLQLVLNQLKQKDSSPIEKILLFVSHNKILAQTPHHALITQLAVFAKNRTHNPQYRQIYQHLNAISNEINQINNASDPNHAAFSVATKRIHNPQQVGTISHVKTFAATLPTPINHWLQQLTKTSWHLIMQATQHTINQQWQTRVYPIYLKQLANRFPFNPTSNQSCSLTAFNHFFAQDGIYHQFFTQYLQPFLNTKPAKWQAKSTDGESIHFSTSAIRQFERASIIRHMFFNTKHHQPQLIFMLQLMSMESSLTALHINYGNDDFTDHPHTTTKHYLYWPIKGNPAMTLTFTDTKGQQTTLRNTGPWAIFKMLWRNKPTTSINPKYFEITFDANGNAAKYLLKLNRTINPFIPGIIDRFELPMSLINTQINKKAH